MNKSDFTQMILNPSVLGKGELSALKKAEADFPYFQAIQVLLARSLSNLNHYDFNKQLHQTSLYVPDREVLYRYIHDQKYHIDETAVVAQPTVIAKEVPVSEPEIEAINAKQLIEAEKPEDIEIQSTEIDQIQEIELVIQEPIIDSLPQFDNQNFTPNETVEEVVLELKPETENHSSSEFITHQGEMHSFLEWLELSKKDVVVKQQKNEEDKTQIQEQKGEPNSNKIQIEHQIELPVNSKIEESSNVDVFESILDKFIKESPRISRPKATFYNPANMAKQSVAEDEDLVTETLAKLYHKQGHHKKAIRAYEKLCLIYPHKMAYFADLIQQIKQESKD